MDIRQVSIEKYIPDYWKEPQRKKIASALLVLAGICLTYHSIRSLRATPISSGVPLLFGVVFIYVGKELHFHTSKTPLIASTISPDELFRRDEGVLASQKNHPHSWSLLHSSEKDDLEKRMIDRDINLLQHRSYLKIKERQGLSNLIKHSQNDPSMQSKLASACRDLSDDDFSKCSQEDFNFLDLNEEYVRQRMVTSSINSKEGLLEVGNFLSKEEQKQVIKATLESPTASFQDFKRKNGVEALPLIDDEHSKAQLRVKFEDHILESGQNLLEILQSCSQEIEFLYPSEDDKERFKGLIIEQALIKLIHREITYEQFRLHGLDNLKSYSLKNKKGRELIYSFFIKLDDSELGSERYAEDREWLSIDLEQVRLALQETENMSIDDIISKKTDLLQKLRGHPKLITKVTSQIVQFSNLDEAKANLILLGEYCRFQLFDFENPEIKSLVDRSLLSVLADVIYSKKDYLNYLSWKTRKALIAAQEAVNKEFDVNHSARKDYYRYKETSFNSDCSFLKTYSAKRNKSSCNGSVVDKHQQFLIAVYETLAKEIS
jgi:hypothetical protein